MSITRKPMTLDEVRSAIGHERPAWAESLESHGRLVILVRAGRPIGDNDPVLVADAQGREPGYHWTGASMLTRRSDLDKQPEPSWLKRARASSRPPAVLHDLLTPQYSSRALEEDMRESHDEQDLSTVPVFSMTYAQFERAAEQRHVELYPAGCPNLCEACARRLGKAVRP